jgi:hypothetical protein
VFTIAGVYACHPETKASLGYLQQFVASRPLARQPRPVSPTIYILTGALAKQNVCKSDGTALALSDFNSQTLTFYGSASTSYRKPDVPQGRVHVRDGRLAADGRRAQVRAQDDGRPVLRVWMASDIRNDELLMRLDILYGFKTLRPAWSCRDHQLSHERKTTSWLSPPRLLRTTSKSATTARTCRSSAPTRARSSKPVRQRC